MKFNRRILFGILLAGLLFFAGILLRDFLLAGFVRPMALMLWIGNRLIASVDQAAYWGGLILVLVLISLLRLSRQADIQEMEGRTENETAVQNNIRHWRTLILLTTDESDRLNFLKHGLQKLLKDIYASKQPSQVLWKVYQDFDQGEFTLPGSIRKFLMLDADANARPTMAQRVQHLRGAPGRWSRRWTKQDQAAYYQSIAEVISFMEKELENDDEQ